MPRIVDHDQQREQILDRSFEFFAKKGYGSTTMRTLAKELGFSTGTLYHYFDGKDDLFRRMFERLSQRHVAEAVGMVDPQDELKIRLEALEAYLEERAEHLQFVVVLAIDYLRSQEGPEARAFLQQTTRFYRDALQERLALPGESLGKALYSFVIGMMVHQLLDPDGVSIAEQLAVLRAMG